MSPGCSRPPTARSSGTVIETARQAAESGLTVSPGPRIANCVPRRLPGRACSRRPAGRLRIVVRRPSARRASTGPRTRPGRSCVDRHLAEHEVRLRRSPCGPGSCRAATTTGTSGPCPGLACWLGLVMTRNARPPATRASTMTPATMSSCRAPRRVAGTRFPSVGYLQVRSRLRASRTEDRSPSCQASRGRSGHGDRQPAPPRGILSDRKYRRAGGRLAIQATQGRTRWTGLPRIETCQVVVSVVVLSNV